MTFASRRNLIGWQHRFDVSKSFVFIAMEQRGANDASDARADERMRCRLRFFFMNPIEKWRARRKFPHKFFVQLIKIVLVTLQLCLFAHNQYKHVNYAWDNRVAFSHLFLKGWDATMEVNAYPPGSGPLAVYARDDLYDAIEFACDGYSKLSNAIGAYSYASENGTIVAPVLCVREYARAEVFGFNESYAFDARIDETCTPLPVANSSCSSRDAVAIDFDALVSATLAFSLKTVHLKAGGPIASPDCYRFDVTIEFDNRDRDGQTLLALDADAHRLECRGDAEYAADDRIARALHSALNALVICICAISLVLCARAVYRAQLLKRATAQFFERRLGRRLSAEGRLEFLNLWYIMIIVDDLLIVSGSAIKERIEQNDFARDRWDVCSVLLGVGNMLVWFGVLRYLGFFKTYNVVILTLKRAAPKISRFLICALLLYAGFTFCGWLVLGPYHMKFRSLSTTSECLFSLINGDDMFATFTSMSGKSTMLWWFSRVYLYAFISLYIYVVLSLFISVIMDSYDTIKRCYKDGFPKSDLQNFIGTVSDEELGSEFYRHDDSCFDAFVRSICFCVPADRSYIKIDSTNDSTTHQCNENTVCI